MTTQIDQQLIATSDLCDLLDLSEGRLSQLVSAGILNRAARGKFKLLESVKSYLQFLRSRAPGSGAPETIEDYRRGRARLISLQADLAQLQLEKERHEVVRIEDVAEGVGDCFSSARAKWLAVPSKYAARIMPEDPARAFKELAKAVREVLVEINEEAEAKIAMSGSSK